MLETPPLALYVHFPWCVRKSPYCDFNSHALHGELEERRYVEALGGSLEITARFPDGAVNITNFGDLEKASGKSQRR